MVESDQLAVSIPAGRTAGSSHDVVESQHEGSEGVAQAHVGFRREQVSPRLRVAAHYFSQRRVASVHHGFEG
jgi:hypothetical protein